MRQSYKRQGQVLDSSPLSAPATKRKSYHYSRGRTCSECEQPIRNANASGLCRKHVIEKLAADPEFQRKRQEGMARKRREDPLYHARMRENMRRVGREAAKDPELRKRRVERGKQHYATVLNTPENRAKVLATRAEVGRKLREQRLAWCPAEYREEYRRLYRNKHIPAAEARKIIETKIAADIAALSPFERQMRALLSGRGTLVELRERPSLARPGYAEAKRA